MWCNGVEPVMWHRKNPNYFVEIPDLPHVGQTLDDIGCHEVKLERAPSP